MGVVHVYICGSCGSGVHHRSIVACGIASVGSSVAVGASFAVGCRYEVMGDKLVVYRYMMPHRYPISKISEVAKSTGHTGTIGLSSRRVTVRFADRSVMKSSLPLQLSPRDRDGFIDALRAVNPSINVEGGIS